MTKLMTLMMVCAFAIGCGGSKKADTTTTNPDTTTTNTDTTNTDTTNTDTTATGEGTPCTQEVALQCPEGQIDGCLKTPQEGDTHKCVAN